MTEDKQFINPGNQYRILIILVSVLIPLIVSYLIFVPKEDSKSDWIAFLPHLNGMINTTTSVTLLLGFIFIKRGKVDLHKLSMLTSFFLGVLFMISYVIYHSNAESTSFGGEGSIKYIYYFLLITHIILALIVVPLVLFALYFALSKKFSHHKKVVKYAFPVWFYVSVSGVIVYLMIRPYY